MFRSRYLLALLLLSSLLGCASVDYGDSEAGLFMEDLATGGRGSRPGDPLALPERTGIEYRAGGRQRRADLYTVSAQPAGAGIVLVPGIAAAGKNDRRLVALARTLARARFTVLVPDIPSFRAYRLRAGDVDEIASAVEHLANSPSVAGKPVGIFAVSYAVAPSVLACLQPSIREQVDFLVGIGGYYDLRSTITFFTTGYFQEPSSGTWQWMAPHPYGRWLFMASNAEFLDAAGDRRMVRDLAWSMLDSLGEEYSPWLQPGPQGQLLLDLMLNEDRGKVPELISRLPERMRQEMTALNPAAHDLSSLSARLILLHGRADSIIPYSESVALAQAAPKGKGRAYVIDGLAHVNLRPKPGDVPLLLEMIRTILAQRELDGEGSSEQ